jgi:hypothetical protein
MLTSAAVSMLVARASPGGLRRAASSYMSMAVA